MCEISEKWFREGDEQGRIKDELNQARKTALELKKMGLPLDKKSGGEDKKLDALRAPKGAKLECIHKTKSMLP